MTTRESVFHVFVHVVNIGCIVGATVLALWSSYPLLFSAMAFGFTCNYVVNLSITLLERDDASSSTAMDERFHDDDIPYVYLGLLLVFVTPVLLSIHALITGNPLTMGFVGAFVIAWMIGITFQGIKRLFNIGNADTTVGGDVDMAGDDSEWRFE